MAGKSPEISIQDHNPTGGANVTISLWLTEQERRDLTNRIIAQETLVHNREKTIEALQLSPEEKSEQDTSTTEMSN